MEKVLYSSIVFLLCVAIKNDVLCNKHDKTKYEDYDGKIVGGYNVTIQEVPYQVYLLLLKGGLNYQCGGSLISSHAVLTAAHCLTGVQRVTIRAGSTDSSSGGTLYSTSVYRIHPRYNPLTSDYDVAVVRTRQAMKLDGTNTRAVSLPEVGAEVIPGTELLVSGWGNTMEDGETSRYLMAVKIPTVSTEECREAYGQNAITERMVCAGVPEGGKDSCQGDSGGPAVDDSTGIQVGIVSFGSGCARPGVPGVYTNVSSVRSWIRRNARI